MAFSQRPAPPHVLRIPYSQQSFSFLLTSKVSPSNPTTLANLYLHTWLFWSPWSLSSPWMTPSQQELKCELPTWTLLPLSKIHSPSFSCLSQSPRECHISLALASMSNKSPSSKLCLRYTLFDSIEPFTIIAHLDCCNGFLTSPAFIFANLPLPVHSPYSSLSVYWSFLKENIFHYSSP